MTYEHATYDQRAEGYAEAPPRRRRRGRKFLIALLVLLVLLGIVLVVADRMGSSYAERRIGAQIDSQLAAEKLSAAPAAVDVGGFPFLTQVLAGRYEEISVVLRELQGAVPGSEAVVKIPSLDIDARDVTASIETLRTGQGDIVAKTVDGVGIIEYASVVELIDQPGLELAERNGKIAGTFPVEILNQRFELNGTAEITVKDGVVQVRFDELTADDLPDAAIVQNLVTEYAKQISINLDLPALPFGLDVQEVRALPEGIQVTATGADIPLNKAGA